MDNYLPMGTCTHCSNYLGVGAPVAADVLGHRALKSNKKDVSGDS